MATLRLSICRVFHRWRCFPKHSANAPVFRVGLPNAKCMGSPSVLPPSDTSQIFAGIADASSNRYHGVELAACKPAKLSLFSSRLVCASTRQLSGCALCTRRIAPLPVVMVNQCLLTARLSQAATPAHVLLASCSPVLAVTTPRLCGLVDMIHSVSQAAIADLPMPWPELTAYWIGGTGALPSKPRATTSRPTLSSRSQAHASGPNSHPKRLAHGSDNRTSCRLASLSHGNAYITNPSGSA